MWGRKKTTSGTWSIFSQLETQHKVNSTVCVCSKKFKSKTFLGLPAIKDLGLIQRIEVVEKRPIPDEFKDYFFNGLGTFKGEYHIKITPGAHPFALFDARHVPFPTV